MFFRKSVEYSEELTWREYYIERCASRLANSLAGKCAKYSFQAFPNILDRF